MFSFVIFAIKKLLLSGKVLRTGGWLKAIPRPPKEGEFIAHGQATEGSGALGNAVSPHRAVSAKVLKGGSAPGGRGVKRHIFA